MKTQPYPWVGMLCPCTTRKLSYPHLDHAAGGGAETSCGLTCVVDLNLNWLTSGHSPSTWDFRAKDLKWSLCRILSLFCIPFALSGGGETGVCSPCFALLARSGAGSHGMHPAGGSPWDSAALHSTVRGSWTASILLL